MNQAPNYMHHLLPDGVRMIKACFHRKEFYLTEPHLLLVPMTPTLHDANNQEGRGLGEGFIQFLGCV